MSDWFKYFDHPSNISNFEVNATIDKYRGPFLQAFGNATTNTYQTDMIPAEHSYLRPGHGPLLPIQATNHCPRQSRSNCIHSDLRLTPLLPVPSSLNSFNPLKLMLRLIYTSTFTQAGLDSTRTYHTGEALLHRIAQMRRLAGKGSRTESFMYDPYRYRKTD